ncbi:MAG: hypothetical protein JWR01_367, partial [Subtercola sp.]|nr:hypothetical protein [Subtercola sp.]
PGTVSHFPARKATVYLPPAALVAHPPTLPVVILFGGQPGTPDQVFASTGLRRALDGFARADRGLAPIVVAADQLGTAHPNPMCVDGPLGNSATYVDVDVVSWIRSHFRVAAPGSGWAIGGFSQGGTCAVQFAARRPDLFSSFIDVAGEAGPTLGSAQATIDTGFGGSGAAYEAAQPAAIMARRGSYRGVTGVFAVGQGDAKYADACRRVEGAARAAGMAVVHYTVAGSGHDWTTASHSFSYGIRYLYPRWGLAGTPPPQPK